MAGTGGLRPADAAFDAARSRLPVDGGFLVALSGGADSAVACWATVEAAGRTRVRAVHVHHGQPASDTMASAAEAVARRLGVSLVRRDVVVAAEGSFETNARVVRMEALETEASEGEWIVTGHHAGDSVETVIAHLVRGAGATGLAGISPMRGRWLRPLIDVPSDVVKDAARDLELPFVDDPANRDPRHRRNVVRAEVVPWLSERFGTPIEEVVVRSARALAADDAYLEDRAMRPAPRRSGTAVVFPAAVLSTHDRAVSSRIARRALRAAHPPYPGNASDVDRVLAVASSGGGPLSLSGGFLVAREGAMVALYDRAEPEPPAAELSPGSSADFGPWRVSMSRSGTFTVPALGRSRVRVTAPADGSRALVRASAPGERIEIAEGTKPVRTALAEAGVPFRLRSAWPVVAVDAKIAWVAGVRIAEWCRTAGTGSEELVELSVEGIGT